jgi:hypothetical protein
MLSSLMVLVLKMIKFTERCVGLKFGDETCLCSILELCDVLMKSDDGFVFAMP